MLLLATGSVVDEKATIWCIMCGAVPSAPCATCSILYALYAMRHAPCTLLKQPTFRILLSALCRLCYEPSAMSYELTCFSPSALSAIQTSPSPNHPCAPCSIFYAPCAIIPSLHYSPPSADERSELSLYTPFLQPPIPPFGAVAVPKTALI